MRSLSPDSARLEKLIAKGQEVLRTHRPNPPNVIGFPTLSEEASSEWAAQSLSALQRAFGSDSVYVTDFPKRAKGGYVDAVRSGIGVLKAALEDSGHSRATAETPRDRIVSICNRFHLFARALGQRPRSRPPFTISDEYDVQDALHALLRLDFDDVRAEEFVPSHAGRASRMDFLLKDVGAVVEVKYVRPDTKAGDIGDELLEDVARYKSHQHCTYLYCFVYDPGNYLVNPRGLEADLSRNDENFEVIAMIRPL